MAVIGGEEGAVVVVLSVDLSEHVGVELHHRLVGEQVVVRQVIGQLIGAGGDSLSLGGGHGPQV